MFSKSHFTPFLYGPCTDNISITDKNFLEFHWKPVNDTVFMGYELKIYEGLKTRKEHLIFSQMIPGAVRATPIEIRLFQPGHTYSWELRQIYFGGEKSRRAYCSFKITPNKVN
ncbi:MAG: hypothetical protein KC733_03920 [Candidatus Omnitrophica bacterium]|nr:hypothetical protein [Candidatus Omnitrophota bacterium]